MKLTRVSLIAPIIMLMAACSDDAPRSGAPTENYVRAFVKEFGVPAKGHDFSMARSAGLKVKASRNTPITVTAEIGGTEYLFADLTVGKGLTAVPATIPSDVTSLNVYVYGEPYRVAPDDVIDLDNLPAGTQDSRTIDFGTQIFDDKTSEPVLCCKYSDILEEWFENYPIDEDIPCWGFEPPLPGWEGVGFYNAETKMCDIGNCYYLIFPVYVKSNGYTGILYNGYGEYQMGKPEDCLFTNTDIIEAEDINTKSIKNYGDNTPYKPDGKDRTIISKGVRFKPRVNGVGVSVESEYGISSSLFRDNCKNWGDNYYPAMLDNLYDVFGCTRRMHLSDCSVKVNKEGTWNEYGGRENSSFLLGFNRPPRKPNDTETVRDYAEVIYLVVIENSERMREYSDEKQTYPTYDWIVAAEDLGGTFDWDFNDAVFKFTDVVENLVTVNTVSKTHYFGAPTDLVPVRKVSVTPMAAGGTMPLYITYTGKVSAMPDMPRGGKIDYYTANEALRSSLNDPEEGTYVIGTEIHKWLGASTYKKQINTGAKVEVPYGETISFAIPTDATPTTARFPVDYARNRFSADNQPLFGFAVLVDRENKLNIDTRTTGGVEYLSSYSIGDGMYLIGKPDDTTDNVAPQMFVVYANNEQSKFEWPREYVSVSDVFKYFKTYLNDPKGWNGPWWENKNHDNVTCRDEVH